MHVPDAKRLKLDARSQKCVMLGYNEESKGYKMINPTTKKVIISRDVVFEEEESWDWGRTEEEARNDILDWGEASDEEAYASSDESEDGDSHQEEGESADGLSSISSGATTPTLPEKRVTRAPPYLQDYTSGEGLSEEEEEVQNLVMFMASDDPIYYEEAVRMKRWRDAMDIEIGAIKKMKRGSLLMHQRESK